MITIPFRIPITIHPAFFLLSGLIAILNMRELIDLPLWFVIVFVSVLIHEYGHALTAQFFGQKTRIDLIGTGGLTSREGKSMALWQEFVVVSNGPLFGFTLALVAYFLYAATPEEASVLRRAFAMTYMVNIFWSVLNLLPITPLDGGKLLSIILEKILGFRGVQIALFVGALFGAAVGFLSFLYSQPFLGVIFFFLAFESYRNFRSSLQMSPADRSDKVHDLFEKASNLAAHGEFSKAYLLFEELRVQAKSGIHHLAATEAMARIKNEQGEFEEAFDLLQPIEKKLSSSILPLYHRLAYHAQDTAAVIRVGARCFEENPSYETAYINALAHALRKEPREAVGWLQSAKREGMSNIKEQLRRLDFDAIRQDPLFQEFENSV